nr:TrmH family RNA methyltransferase [Spirosomataceae bacterium]
MKKLAMDELNRLSVEEFGSVFRTADAFAAEKIYLCGITATPPHRDIEKTALGATESVDWEYAQNALELVEKLQTDGWIVMAVEQVEGSLKLNEFSPEKGKKYAFVMGNEVFGVNEEIVKKADYCLEIPQFGT